MFAVLMLPIAMAAAVAEPRALMPMLCLDTAGRYQPIARTNYGQFKAAFQRQFGFSSRLVQTTPQSGTLTFAGPGRAPETIRYQVQPYDDGKLVGVALIDMRVRLRGVTQNLSGDEMCWQVFSTVNVQ